MSILHACSLLNMALDPLDRTAMHWTRYAFPQQIRVQTRQSSVKILSRLARDHFHARPHSHM